MRIAFVVLLLVVSTTAAAAATISPFAWHQYGGNHQHSGTSSQPLLPPSYDDMDPTTLALSLSITPVQSWSEPANFVTDSRDFMYSVAGFGTYETPFVFAVDLSNSSAPEVWRTDVGNWQSGPPSSFLALSNDESLLFAGSGQNLSALHPRTGRAVWSIGMNGCPPQFTIGPVSGNLYVVQCSSVVAIAWATGVTLWTQTRPPSPMSYQQSAVTTMALDDDETIGVVGYTDDENDVGYIYGYNLRVPNPKLPPPPVWSNSYSSGGWSVGFAAPPLIVQNQLVLAPCTGFGLVMIDLFTGASINNGSGWQSFSYAMAPPTPITVNRTANAPLGVVVGLRSGFETSYDAVYLTQVGTGAMLSYDDTSLMLQNQSYPMIVVTQPFVTTDNYVIIAIGDESQQSGWGGLRLYSVDQTTSEFVPLWRPADGQLNDLNPESSMVVTSDHSIWLIGSYLYRIRVLVNGKDPWVH